jgi:small-conductance mechanosensitive channel
MSFLSDVFDWLSDLWDKFVDFHKYLYDNMLKIHAILLIVAAIVFLPGVGVALGLAVVSSWWVVGLCLVAAFLIDPETAASVINDIGEVLGDVAVEVADVTGDIIGSIASGLFGNISPALLLIGGGFILFFLLTGDKKK